MSRSTRNPGRRRPSVLRTRDDRTAGQNPVSPMSGGDHHCRVRSGCFVMLIRCMTCTTSHLSSVPTSRPRRQDKGSTHSRPFGKISGLVDVGHGVCEYTRREIRGGHRCGTMGGEPQLSKKKNSDLERRARYPTSCVPHRNSEEFDGACD